MKTWGIRLTILAAVYFSAQWCWGEFSEQYFHYRCIQEGGEFIYRTVQDVEGVFQMRPREKGEYFSRLRKGDLMEDPYGHTNLEARYPWGLLLPMPTTRAYTFFESSQGPDPEEYDRYKRMTGLSARPVITGEPYWRYTYDGVHRESHSYGVKRKPKQVSRLKSQYGFTWRQVQTRLDRLFGVIGGELIVQDLASDEVLGVRRGFFFWSAWSKRSGVCPRDKTGSITYAFITKVLIPPVFEGELEEKDYGY